MIRGCVHFPAAAAHLFVQSSVGRIFGLCFELCDARTRNSPECIGVACSGIEHPDVRNNQRAKEIRGIYIKPLLQNRFNLIAVWTTTVSLGRFHVF